MAWTNSPGWNTQGNRNSASGSNIVRSAGRHSKRYFYQSNLIIQLSATVGLLKLSHALGMKIALLPEAVLELTFRLLLDGTYENRSSSPAL